MFWWKCSPGILIGWEQYILELFGHGSCDERLRWDADISGPPILRSEIEIAVKRIKSGKAAGKNGAVVEMIEAVGQFTTEKITCNVNRTYDEGYFPEVMRESVFVAIPKKHHARSIGQSVLRTKIVRLSSEF